jgi:hypothetical protein
MGAAQECAASLIQSNMAETETVIKLRFTYTFSDWLSMHRFYDKHTGGQFKNRMYAVFCFGMGFWFLWRHYAPTLQTFLFYSLFDVLLIAFLLLAGIAIWFDLASILGYWSGHRKAAKEMPQEYEIAFDGNGASYSLGHDPAIQEVKLAWTQFKEVLESKDAFLIVLHDKQFWGIPKHYFSSPDEIKTFRRLLIDKFGSRASIHP